MRILYIAATWLLFPLLFPVLVLMKKTREGVLERLGFYGASSLPAPGHPRIWLHGASAGDLLALAPMIQRLRTRYPAAKVIVSTMTNTGRIMARERLTSHIDAVVYAPWDLFGATRRAIKSIRPDLLVLEYTEIWPNLISAAHRAGTRIALTNGRFSERHLSRYRTFFSLIGNPLRDIDLFLMREEAEAARVRSLGADEARVRVTGNTKFDALVPLAQTVEDAALRNALGIPRSARVWIAGSTHEGEEETLFAVYRRLIDEAPDLMMVVAPRYVDRAERVAQLAREAGLHVALRSKGNVDQAPVVILDSIGELARAYRLASIVFVGGSFTTRGGQNILEPAAQGKPVLFGPHMDNFADSVKVLVGRGGIQVNDAEHLVRVMTELLHRPESVESLGLLASNAVRQISGASDRNVEALAALLPTVPAPAGEGQTR